MPDLFFIFQRNAPVWYILWGIESNHLIRAMGLALDHMSHYRFFLVQILGIFAGSIFAATTPTFEIGTWGNFCQGAISHTFDDYGMSGTGQATGTGQAAFDTYGFHMTIFVVTGGPSNPSWTNLKNAFAKGHEIASHSVTHASTMPVSELGPSQQTIKKDVPGEMCATIAYPNCNTPGDAQVLQYYIAGRNCSGSVNSKSPSNWAEISSKMFGAGQCGCPNDAASFNSFADQAVSNNGWAVTCNHGIGSDTHTWAVTSLDAMKSHLGYLDQNRGKIWIETFGNVARYIHERDAAKITVKSSDVSGITAEVTDNLADSIYNFPLSIRTPLPSGWTTAVVKQNAKTVWDTIVTVGSKQYIMFKAVPNAGDVVISQNATKAIRRVSGSSAGAADPVTRLQTEASH